MSELRGWSIYAWVALPTVMYGGYALLGLLTKTNALTPFGRTWFRAGHAHAGVMLLMALLFFDYLSHTRLSLAAKHIACGTLEFSSSQAAFSLIWQRAKRTVRQSAPLSRRLAQCSSPFAIAILVYALFFAHA
jgi:hypothetical protein